jgi:hypothetical protein
MTCEKCETGTMEREVVNYLPAEGYSTLIKLTCSACDFSFMKVA